LRTFHRSRTFILFFVLPFLSSLAIVSAIFSFSTFQNRQIGVETLKASRLKQSTSCTGKAFLVYKNLSRVFQDNLVSLGPPNNIISHAAVAAIGTNSLANSKEILPRGLHSVRGAFIYEIDDPNARLILYKLGFLDTTVLPPYLYADLARSHPALARYHVIIKVLDSNNTPELNLNPDSSKRLSKIYSVGSFYVQSYMVKHFNMSTWVQGPVCK